MECVKVMRRRLLLSAPVDWLVRLALDIRSEQLAACGLNDVEATQMDRRNEPRMQAPTLQR
jgi:hypothetical protein